MARLKQIGLFDLRLIQKKKYVCFEFLMKVNVALIRSDVSESCKEQII